MHKVAVGILGGSGYTGRELGALVVSHPRLELVFAAANEQRGKTVRLGRRDVTFIATDEAPLGDVQLLFSALPHGSSAAWVKKARELGAKIVDLSSDLRPGNGVASEGIPYGLTELLRSEIRGADVVANPGCYPTAVLLGLAPALEQKLVAPGATITIDAASGVTGAGFTPRPDLMFAEVAQDFRAYAPGNVHRHLPEMQAMVARLGGDVDLLFTPHLLPVARGILATMTVPLAFAVEDPARLWREFYANEPFVQVVTDPPSLKDVVHRNVMQVAVFAASGLRRPTLTVFAALDNLVKGAAGQAMQNANLLLGFEETLGLPA